MPRNNVVLRHPPTYLGSDIYEDTEECEIVILEVLDSGSYDFLPGTLLPGRITQRIHPNNMMACVVGDEILVGVIQPIDSQKFHLADQIFWFDDIDFMVLIDIPEHVQRSQCYYI